MGKNKSPEDIAERNFIYIHIYIRIYIPRHHNIIMPI